MNILILFRLPIVAHCGGVQRVTHILTEEFLRRGHNVVFLASENRNNYKDTITIQEYISFDDIKSCKIDYMQILSRYKINLVICQELTPENYFLLSITPCTIKKISFYHGSPFGLIGYEREINKLSKPTDLFKFCWKYLCILMPFIFRFKYIHDNTKRFQSFSNVSDKLLFLSDKFFPTVLKYCTQIDKKKLSSLPNPNTFEEPENVQYFNKEQLVIFVGRLSEVDKNVKGFIDVWNNFSTENKSWKAFIIGDGEDRCMLEEYAVKTQSRNLRFLGNQEDIESFYKRASILCVTSRGEGWGMVLTEAMRYGCIPFCYDSYASLHDIITDGIDGFLIPMHKKNIMVQRMNELIQHPILMQNIATNAQKKIKKYSVKNVVNQWEQLINKI